MNANIHTPAGTERATLLAERKEIDAELIELNAKIGQAKTDAHLRSRYMDPNAFRRMERRRDALAIRSRELGERLGDLRALEKRANIRATAAANTHFRCLARRVLGVDLFDALALEAEERAADQLERDEYARTHKVSPPPGERPIERPELPEDEIAEVLRARGWTCEPPR